MDIGEIWDGFVDELDYLIHFEWVGDSLEFFSGFFENIGEFSFPGILYGIILVVLVYLFRESVFTLTKSFPLQIIFYIVAFVMGYLMGKRIWD